MAADYLHREMIFGLLALQQSQVSQDQLLAAVTQWFDSPHVPLAEIFVAKGMMTQADCELLQTLVKQFLANQGDDSSQVLAALGSDSSLVAAIEMLKSVEHPKLAATLSVFQGSSPNLESTLNLPGDLASRPRLVREPSKAGSRFRILRPLARGGLGEISVAEDTELHREIALKEIQGRYADDKASRDRFVLEAEVTGGLEHPGIVPVYGLGQFQDGRPYYAMRFIKGDNLKEAIDDFHGRRRHEASPQNPTESAKKTQGLYTRSRLELRKLLGRFIDVCQAISYAHSRGVLHRDLKPGNIMLGKYGETLVVDWGLAKIRDRDDKISDDDQPLRPASGSNVNATVLGTTVGTPAYMPPEQAAGALEEVSAASDVYSLGATLYHVLTGQAPFQGADFPTLVKDVKAGNFPAPRQIVSDIPSQLEAICLKAMALKPSERYQSAQALADEIERFLADEAVFAYPESWLIRLRRWMRQRPKMMTAIAATTMVGLLSLFAIAAVVSGKNVQLAEKNGQLNTANQQLAEKNTALLSANEAERAAKQFADTQRIQAEAVTDYLVDAFRKADPSEDGLQTKVVDVIDQAVEQLQSDFDDQPLIKSRLLHAFSKTYDGLGLPQESFNTSQKAYELRRDYLGEANEETLASLSRYALAYEGIGNVNSAIPLHIKCLQGYRDLLGEDNDLTLTTLNNLAMAYLEAGDASSAMSLQEECVAKKTKLLGDEHTSTLDALANLALIYDAAGQPKKALALYELCLERRLKVFGAKHPVTFSSINNLALAYKTAGDLAKAIPLYEQCLKDRSEVEGKDHPDTLATMNNLAAAYRKVGEMAKALPLYEECLALKQAKLGDNHPSTLTTLNNLASAHLTNANFSQAIPLLTKGWENRRDVLGADHPDTLLSLNNLAVAFKQSGDIQKAIPLYEQSLKQQSEKLGADHPQTLLAMSNLGIAYRDSDDVEKAILMLVKCLDSRREQLGEKHPDTLLSLENLARSYLQNDQPEMAKPLYAQYLDIQRERLGRDDLELAGQLLTVAKNHMKYHQYAAAEGFLREGLSIQQAVQPNTWSTYNTMSILGETLLEQAKLQREAQPDSVRQLLGLAEPLLLESYQGMQKHKEEIPDKFKLRLTESLERLIDFYRTSNRPDEAIQWQNALDKLPR